LNYPLLPTNVVTYVLVAVSIDRLDAIAQPINYLRNGQSRLASWSHTHNCYALLN